MAKVRCISCAAVTALLLSLPAGRSRACTTFCISRGAQVVVGKSYDFHVGHGLLVVNKRGVAKRALVLTPKARPAAWVSKYGSVTFNQYGREFPLGGMNEAGLVVEIMWLSSTQHPPAAADKGSVNELQLIQYLLDTSASVKQAVAAARKVHVDKVHAPVHYLTCDRDGKCATIEHLGGRLVVHAGARLPVRVLANNPYAASLRFLRGHQGFGGKRPIPAGNASLARFVRAAAGARAFAATKQDGVAHAFATLDDLRQADYTKWQIVYEPRPGRIHFRKGGEKAYTTVEAHKLRYGCDSPVEVMDVYGTLSKGYREGVRKRVPYSRELNLRLVQRSFAELKAPFPPEALKGVAGYPERLPCGKPTKMIEGTQVEDTPNNRKILAVIEAYRAAMVKRDPRALVALVHPAYADDAGTPSPADDLGRAAVIKLLRGRLKQVQQVRYRIEYKQVRWERPDRATVDTFVDGSFQIGGKWHQHADPNRFVLQRHRGRWLFLRGM